MSELEWLEPVELRRPLLLVAFEGLFDAAEAATTAVQRLVGANGGKPVANIDPETFFNFQELRPTVSLGDEGQRVLTWPQNRVWAAKIEGAPHDLLLLRGVEPHLRWRSFANCILELANETGAEMVVTLGAMLGMAPHTRPLGVVGSAASPALARRLGLGSPSYEGPTGLVGALHNTLDEAGMPVISLRVSVPHYVPNPPNPEATRSLLRRLEIVTGVPTEHERLDEAAAEWRERIDSAVRSDNELAGYVSQLEAQVDSSDDILPSGDDIATELEAFLRDQRGDDDTPSGG